MTCRVVAVDPLSTHAGDLCFDQLITKMEDNHLKRAVMVRYLKSDLLAVNNDEDEDEDEEEGACQAFLRRVSEATPSGVGAGLRTAHYGDFAESLVRLLNVLASIKMGRDYLGELAEDCSHHGGFSPLMP